MGFPRGPWAHGLWHPGQARVAQLLHSGEAGPTAVVGSTVAVRAWLVGTSRHEPFLATEHNTLQCARPVDERTAWTVATWQLTQRGQPSVLFVSSSTHRSITAQRATRNAQELSAARTFLLPAGWLTILPLGLPARRPLDWQGGSPCWRQVAQRMAAADDKELYAANTKPW